MQKNFINISRNHSDFFVSLDSPSGGLEIGIYNKNAFQLNFQSERSLRYYFCDESKSDIKEIIWTAIDSSFERTSHTEENHNLLAFPEIVVLICYSFQDFKTLSSLLTSKHFKKATRLLVLVRYNFAVRTGFSEALDTLIDTLPKKAKSLFLKKITLSEIQIHAVELAANNKITITMFYPHH